MFGSNEPDGYNDIRVPSKAEFEELKRRFNELERDYKEHIHEGSLVCPYFTGKPTQYKRR